VKMKNKIAGILLIVIINICYMDIFVCAKETPDELTDLYAQSAVLMDADSGRILFGKNEEKILPMASTTKIMTCILALEHMEYNQTIEVSKAAASQPKVHLGVREGERFYIRDLLYSLMLESHNDSAVMIAEGIAGSVDKFSDLMNLKAQELGCADTYFITPNGLDAKDENGRHSTTASDLARIMRYCIQGSEKSEEFLNITRTKAYQFSDVENMRSYSCSNHNAFLGMMEGVLSGKTGFTNEAGYCYVAALKRGERTFIVSLLACGWPNNKTYKWKDTKRLMEYGLSNYEYRNLYQEWEDQKISVINGAEKKSVAVGIEENDKEILLLALDSEEAELKVMLQDKVNAPIQKNQTVGHIIYYLDDEVLKIYDIVSMEDVRERNYLWCFIKVSGLFLLQNVS